MSTSSDRGRLRWLPKGFVGFAGLACAACCVIPLLFAAGMFGGAGWATIGQALPAVALVLAAGAGLVWWWVEHRKKPQCATGCGCSSTPQQQRSEEPAGMPGPIRQQGCCTAGRTDPRGS